MANISEYLDWRGDVPFSLDPFNEADNLILAELAYTDFEGVVPGEEDPAGISIQEAAALYFTLHTEEELLKRQQFTRMAPFLLKKLAAAPRFAGLRLSSYVNDIDLEKEAQFSAVVYRMPGITYIAYRGTDDTIVGWKEDLNLSYQYETAGQRNAVQYLNRHASEAQETFLVGGHSKGGNFAVFASAFCLPEVQAKISRVYSNDGPGFITVVTETPGYQAILPRVRSIIPEGSLIGILLSGDQEHEVVKSTEKGIMQHDALSWEVYVNRFSAAEARTYGSLFADRTIRNWLQDLKFEDRKLFIDAVFSALTGSGAETFPELFSDKSKFAADIMKSMGALPKERQQELREILKRFVKSGTDILLSDVRNLTVSHLPGLPEKRNADG